MGSTRAVRARSASAAEVDADLDPDADADAHLTEIVLSPHFDDAALSAASVLHRAGPSALVVTVCGGEPDSAVVEDWDLECGFESGRAAAAGRAAEDRAAAAVVGHRFRHLPVPDEPYQHGFPAADVEKALGELLRPGRRLWAPAGIGAHPDHVQTREAALSVAFQTGCDLTFYADCPYAFTPGWDAPDQARHPDDRWDDCLARIAGQVGLAEARTVRLGDAAMRAKLAMVRCHASQLAGLGFDKPRLLDWDGSLRSEVFWPTLAPNVLTGDNDRRS
jgi:LmbE family N-acetylglucosaminyl deacetylase